MNPNINQTFPSTPFGFSSNILKKKNQNPSSTASVCDIDALRLSVCKFSSQITEEEGGGKVIRRIKKKKNKNNKSKVDDLGRKK